MRRRHRPAPGGILLGAILITGSVHAQSGGPFLVKPYLVYPSDKPVYPEYENAVRGHLIEVQRWYFDHLGVTFELSPLVVSRSAFPYTTMRCGEKPGSACLSDPKRLDGNWGYFMNRAIHHGVEKWEHHTVALIFSAGGGGYAGSNLYPGFSGFSIVGDWVLEPLSGIANQWGIPCRYSDGWQCSGHVPRGTMPHELGHAFGLPHPDAKFYPGKSIMRWHGDYPDVGFLPHEAELLRHSPFLHVHARP